MSGYAIISVESKFLDNRYFVLHTVSEDRAGKTFLAVDLSDPAKKRCAIEMSKLIVERPQLRQRIQQKFAKKVKVLEQLNPEQQQLPQIYTHFYSLDACYLVRELVTGVTLQKKVTHQGTFSPIEVRRILIELLPAIVKLHSRDLIHQNIKPENIMLRDGDNLPVLLGFGNVEQKLTTENDGDGKELSLKANAKNRAVPEYLVKDFYKASDLYSLGLTAIYLLTGESPQNLQTNFSKSRIGLPEAVATLDPHLAVIIERAIDPKLNCYYSATEMLSALQSSQLDSETLVEPQVNTQIANSSAKISSENDRASQQAAVKFPITLSLLTMGVAIAIGWLIWQQEQTLSRISNATQPKAFKSEELWRLPSPNIAWESINNTQQPVSTPAFTDMNIPIFVTGMQQSQLIARLGQPQSIEKGYWANSNALVYKNVVPDTVDVSYLVDRTSGRLKQTEIALAQTLDLAVMQQTLAGLLQGKTTPSIRTGLQQVYQRQIDSYTFELDQLQGTIKRIQQDNKDNVYIGIWEADFH